MTRQIVWDFNIITSCIIMGNFASKTQEKEAIWIVVHHVVVDGREGIGTMVRNESKWFWTSYVQGLTGSQYPTRPELFFEYPTRPDPKIENDWVLGNKISFWKQ